jgi:RNA polymerase sigma factor (TIGR02999 family)
VAVPKEITALLQRWKAGDKEALTNLTSLTYDDLHSIAMGYLRRESAGGTLQATSLVNELYLKLVRIRGVGLSDRRHFFTFAAKLMRAILTDYARRSRSQKRGGAGERVPLHENMAWVDASSEEMLALDVALEQLEAIEERKVRVLELRFFLGCTTDETAALLDISPATADRDLLYARTWLYRKLAPTRLKT